ncbi:Ribosomal lysine N-methyltransferase set11 [Madurella mycetomatis]|uniref:Ribosomal lysine N-methyltransferase set11 n=1 Tax=Madurella mycetomatis TaxID=100816 RepID=A0A175WBC1_9PEZI|nr:Ribosomal lysine N-methyltransferase set11 [Madurella mycetomatis]
MEVYDELLRWAGEKGIELHGVEPRAIPGRGVGVVATKPLKADERLLYVPTSALRTLDTVRPKIKKSLPPGTKVQAILAAELALEKPTSKYAPWTAVIPSHDSIISSLPLSWEPALHPYLPKPARSLLGKQQSKFDRDWTAVQQHLVPALPASQASSLTRQRFLYAWLLVNTRTFYHETSRTARLLPKDDRMVLQPVADLFNHADGGCEVAFTPGSFTITADREYRPGEEVCICYGRHPNDFLLVEYGFVLTRNRWDEACIDDAVMPEFDDAQREALEEQGFWGKYVLDERTVCYRTQVAVRLLCVGDVEVWKGFVAEGEDGGEEMQREVDRLLVRVLKRYLGKLEGTVEELGRVEAGEPCQREVLDLRWKQIMRLIRRTIERLET